MLKEIDFFNAEEVKGTHAIGIFKGYFDSKEVEVTVNYSYILTHLIKECGRLCNSYASDLFIQWSAVMDKLKESDFLSDSPKEEKTVRFLFGIKESGVDSNECIEENILNYGKYAHLYYRALYVVEIRKYCVYYTDCFEGSFDMKLKKCYL